jgi:hypothetical protein
MDEADYYLYGWKNFVATFMVERIVLLPLWLKELQNKNEVEWKKIDILQRF